MAGYTSGYTGTGYATVAPFPTPPALPLTYTVKMDLAGTAFGGTPVWTDVSAYVVPGKNPGTVTDGRQDESSDVNPGQFTFTLDNRDGRFTPNLASSPYYPHVKAGVRVRLEVVCNSTIISYYDGYADSFETYLDADRAWGLCDVTCTDVLARLGRTVPLRSILTEEILKAGPIVYVPMTDTVNLWGRTTIPLPLVWGSASFGFVATALTQGDYTFGATGPPGDTSGGLTLVDYSASDGYVFQTTVSATLGATAFAAGVWFHNSVKLTGRPLVIKTTAGDTLGVDVTLPSTSMVVKSFAGATSSTGTSGALTRDKWHLLGVEATATGAGPYTVTVKVYVDGVLLETASRSLTSKTVANVQIGGQMISGASTTLIPGDYAHLAVWSSAPSWSTLYSAGHSGLGGESTSARVSRLLGYRASGVTLVTSGTYSGTVGAQDLDGASLQSALFDVAHVEAAPLYADGQGRIVLLNRGQMTSPATAATLDGHDGDLMPTLRVRSDNEYLLNDYTVTGSSGNAQRAQDTASQTANGYFANSLTAPFNSDSDALAVATQAVTGLADPGINNYDIDIDVFALASHNAALAATLLGLRTGAAIVLTNLPAPFSATSSVKIIQGRTFTFTKDSALLTLVTMQAGTGVVSTPTGAAA